MQYSTSLLRHLRRTIGRNIHHRRFEQKLPLQKLSKLSGVPVSLLNHYELGKNEIRLDELLKIACALGMDAGRLLAQPSVDCLDDFKYADYILVTIRLTSLDLIHLKARAVAEGLPYQTLLSSLVHKYVNGQMKLW